MLMLLREGFKKISGIFHYGGRRVGGGWGGRIGPFSTKKNIGSKYWKWPKMHFKANLFFFQFLGGSGAISRYLTTSSI